MLDALLDVLPLESGCILPTIGDGKDCPAHNRRLAAAISVSAPPEAWTEDTAPGAATVVAAETDFAFMKGEPGEPGEPGRDGDGAPPAAILDARPPSDGYTGTAHSSSCYEAASLLA